jgi:transcriptional regulator with XRE-family HTH domain
VDVNLQRSVGRNIRRFRLEDGLTIEELAFRAQLHPNYLGDAERGRRNPSLLNLKKIADGLKRPLADLLAQERGGTQAPVSPAGEKTAVYFSPAKEGDLLSLIKTLRRAAPVDRKHIIQLAKSLSAKLKRR